MEAHATEVIAYGAGVESESFASDVGGNVVEGAGAGGGVPSV